MGSRSMSKLNKEQRQLLFQFVEGNENIAKGKFSASFGAKDAAVQWNKIARKLNSLGGATKTWKEWRKSWHDIKTSTKAKISALAREGRRKGGGPPLEEELSEFQRKVYFLLRKNCVLGHAETKESKVKISEEVSFPVDIFTIPSSEYSDTIPLFIPPTTSITSPEPASSTPPTTNITSTEPASSTLCIVPTAGITPIIPTSSIPSTVSSQTTSSITLLNSVPSPTIPIYSIAAPRKGRPEKQRRKENASIAAERLVDVGREKLLQEDRRLALEERKIQLKEKLMDLESKRVDLERKIQLKEKLMDLESKRVDLEEKRVGLEEKKLGLEEKRLKVQENAVDILFKIYSKIKK